VRRSAADGDPNPASFLDAALDLRFSDVQLTEQTVADCADTPA
jgi:hypothetical protein